MYDSILQNDTHFTGFIFSKFLYDTFLIVTKVCCNGTSFTICGL